jgi:hypothetical protein
VNVGYSWGEAKNDVTLIGVGTESESRKMDGVIGGFQAGDEERLTAAYIYTLLLLPGLAPDITTAIVNGRPTTTTQRQNVNAQGFAASRRPN